MYFSCSVHLFPLFCLVYQIFKSFLYPSVELCCHVSPIFLASRKLFPNFPLSNHWLPYSGDSMARKFSNFRSSVYCNTLALPKLLFSVISSMLQKVLLMACPMAMCCLRCVQGTIFSVRSEHAILKERGRTTIKSGAQVAHSGLRRCSTLRSRLLFRTLKKLGFLTGSACKSAPSSCARLLLQFPNLLSQGLAGIAWTNALPTLTLSIPVNPCPANLGNTRGQCYDSCYHPPIIPQRIASLN